MLSGEEEKIDSKRDSLWEQLPSYSASCITLDMFYISTENIIISADFLSCGKKTMKKKYYGKCYIFGSLFWLPSGYRTPVNSSLIANERTCRDV